jgi:hypothetical protein
VRPATPGARPATRGVELGGTDREDRHVATSVGITARCPILRLEIQELNIYLLGLRIATRAPIVLDVSAQSGSGSLLGNLLCYVAEC